MITKTRSNSGLNRKVMKDQIWICFVGRIYKIVLIDWLYEKGKKKFSEEFRLEQLERVPCTLKDWGRIRSVE
jgi:hypothetical protein